MRTRRQTLLAVIDGMDTVAQETTSGALAWRVTARIARREGRWREKMAAEAAEDEREPIFPEAA